MKNIFFIILSGSLICFSSYTFADTSSKDTKNETKKEVEKILIRDHLKAEKSSPVPVPSNMEKEEKEKKLSSSDFYKKGREAYFLFTERGYRKAIQFFDQAIEINKKDALALAGKAEAQALLSHELNGIDEVNFEMQAFSNAFIATELRPDLCETHRALSMAFFIQNRFKEGKTEAKKAIALNEKDSESHLLFWLNSPDKKKLKSDDIGYSNYYDALDIDSESIENAIELNPDIILPYLELGEACASQEKYSEGIDNFKTVIELNPENEKAYTSLGFIYNEQSNLNKAIEHFDKALEIEPNYLPAIYGKGIAYLKKRDRNTAAEYFSKACNLGYEDSCDLRENPDLQFWRKNIWNKRRNNRNRGGSLNN